MKLLLEVGVLAGEVLQVRAACRRLDVDVPLGRARLADALQPRDRVAVLRERRLVELDDDADEVRLAGGAAGGPGGYDAEHDQ